MSFSYLQECEGFGTRHLGRVNMHSETVGPAGDPQGAECAWEHQ